MAIRGPLI